MLWSSDAPPVPEKRAVETAPEDTSTESLESLMHVGSTSEKQEAELSPVPTPPLSVPKDKIDLLEEEGKISPRFDVPLVDQPAMPIVEEGEEEDEEGMEEVELEEAEKDEEAEQKLDQDATSHLLISEDAMEEPEDQGTLDAKSSTEESPANAQTPAVCDFASEEKEVGDEEEVLGPSEADEVDKANDEAKEAI